MAGKLLAVYRILMDAQLDVPAELLVKLLVVVLAFGDLLEKFHAFLDDVLVDDLEDLVLLEHLMRYVEGRSSESTTPLTKLR